MTADDTPAIKFIATFPHINSAISIHGECGMRITLDVADSELVNALMAIRMRDKQMQVTIEEY
jgi:hypothetical protein